MNKNQVITAVTQAQIALSAIPAGRSDSIRGTIDFQLDILAYRTAFARFIWALHGFAGRRRHRRNLSAQHANHQQTRQLNAPNRPTLTCNASRLCRGVK